MSMPSAPTTLPSHRSAPTCTAFEGARCIASGALPAVVARAKEVVDRSGPAAVLIFDDVTSALVEIDFRGTLDETLARLAEREAAERASAPHDPTLDGPRPRGRPRLGVVAREVTLLPRHWEWLSEQSGGASVALRRLVETARRANEQTDRRRRARDAAYRFIAVMAGDAPGFEEATRALFAGNEAAFATHSAAWPVDVRTHAAALAAATFQTTEQEDEA